MVDTLLEDGGQSKHNVGIEAQEHRAKGTIGNNVGHGAWRARQTMNILRYGAPWWGPYGLALLDFVVAISVTICHGLYSSAGRAHAS